MTSDGITPSGTPPASNTTPGQPSSVQTLISQAHDLLERQKQLLLELQSLQSELQQLIAQKPVAPTPITKEAQAAYMKSMQEYRARLDALQRRIAEIYVQLADLAGKLKSLMEAAKLSLPHPV